MIEKPVALPVEAVSEFVRIAHNDLARVKELLEQMPTLVNASNDWGGGDWETGLGAAAHMGRRDIAEFLLAHGARIDLFAAAMLDQLDVVKTMLTAYPEMCRAKGPHDIPLLEHARAGSAAAVIAYLEAL